jgi:hypothetical protein
MFHNTEEEAKAQANKVLGDTERDAYDGGWDEEVGRICWGRVVERAQQVEIRKGEPDEEFDEYIVYALRPA